MDDTRATDIVDIRTARLADLDPATLYALLKLRVDTFVVEQECAYPELDGRDTEPDALQVWAERDGKVLGCLRVLRERDDAARIGRVCTALGARGAGVADRLMRHALEQISERTCRLNAQSHLAGFYARHGFAVTGPEHDEDGIPHLPMERSAMACSSMTRRDQQPWNPA